MEVDLVHRHDLGVASAGRAALQAEAGTERGLAQTDDRLPADAVERIAEADRRRRLALAGRGRVDRRHKNELAVGSVPETAKKIILELGDEAAEGMQGGFGRADLRGDLRNRLQTRSPRDFDVRPHERPIPRNPAAGRPRNTANESSGLQRFASTNPVARLERVPQATTTFRIAGWGGANLPPPRASHKPASPLFAPPDETP